MKVCRDLDEFYRTNDKDLTNILVKKFKSTLKFILLEDLKSEIYLRLHSKNYVANYRPLEIEIDISQRKWKIKPSYAKFSTYLCKFIFNYIYAYHSKADPNDTCLSLDSYDDCGFNKHGDSKKKFSYKNIPDESQSKINFRLELEKYLENIKNKTKNKGTLVFDNSGEEKIIRVLDGFGNKGCDEKTFIKLVSDGFIDETFDNNLSSFTKDQIVKVSLSLEKNGVIKSEITKEGNKRYYLDDPMRRSLYRLLKYYIAGYKDREISEKFKMSVAGIGVMKRLLRKKIEGMRTDY